MCEPIQTRQIIEFREVEQAKRLRSENKVFELLVAKQIELEKRNFFRKSILNRKIKKIQNSE